MAVGFTFWGANRGSRGAPTGLRQATIGKSFHAPLTTIPVNRLLPILVITLFLSPCALGREPKYDPASGRIRVFYLGDALGQSSPVWQISMDPRFSTTPVPAMQMFGYLGGAENVQKFQRLYLPRKYSDLVKQQDLIILSDTESTLYTVKHITWFSDSVERDGMGLMMVGGRQTLLGEWAGTSVEEALPGDFLGLITHEHFAMKSIPVDPESEFARSLPFEEMPPWAGLIVFTPKQGATTVLRASPKNVPILLIHDYGEGSGMILAPDWAGAWTGSCRTWDYWPDFISNMLHLVSGLKIPQDPALMHALREHFGDYTVSYGLILSLVDFADKFGANTRVLLNRLSELSDKRSDVNQKYIDQEYEQALEGIANLESEMVEVYHVALKLKDQALTWVYLTEVTALTGTSLVAGSLVWMLMIKRKLYKEVSTTKPKRMEY